MDLSTRDLVRRRADDRCEYCRLHQRHSRFTFHIEHVVARQHGGVDELGNLALACHRCNLHKGPNLTGIDPITKAMASLFHPRKDDWHEHSALAGVRIEGLTGIGRATVQVLAMNDARRLELRTELLAAGELP